MTDYLNVGGAKLEGEGEYVSPNAAESEQKKEIHQEDNGEVDIVDVDNIDESDVVLPNHDAVEMKTPHTAEEDPMEALASEAESLAEPVKGESIPVIEDKPPVSGPAAETSQERELANQKIKTNSIDMSKVVVEHIPGESKRPGFDPTSTIDARRDVRQEGGIARNRTTGNQFHSNGLPEGGQLKANVAKIDKTKAYEVSGFEISFERVPGQGNITIPIVDYFPDMETAQAGINGTKYLMPMPGIGYKVVDITSGAPLISYQDRVLMEYINGKWRRK